MNKKRFAFLVCFAAFLAGGIATGLGVGPAGFFAGASRVALILIFSLAALWSFVGVISSGDTSKERKRMGFDTHSY